MSVPSETTTATATAGGRQMTFVDLQLIDQIADAYRRDHPDLTKKEASTVAEMLVALGAIDMDALRERVLSKNPELANYEASAAPPKRRAPESEPVHGEREWVESGGAAPGWWRYWNSITWRWQLEPVRLERAPSQLSSSDDEYEGEYMQVLAPQRGFEGGAMANPPSPLEREPAASAAMANPPPPKIPRVVGGVDDVPVVEVPAIDYFSRQPHELLKLVAGHLSPSKRTPFSLSFTRARSAVNAIFDPKVDDYLPLRHAIDVDNPEIIELAIANRIDLSQLVIYTEYPKYVYVERTSVTPLTMAAVSEHLVVLAALLKDPHSTPDAATASMLRYLAFIPNMRHVPKGKGAEVLSLFADAGVDFSRITATLLGNLFQRGINLELLRLLVSRGAKIHGEDGFPDALRALVNYSDEPSDMFEFLLARSNVNAVRDGQTILFDLQPMAGSFIAPILAQSPDKRVLLEMPDYAETPLDQSLYRWWSPLVGTASAFVAAGMIVKTDVLARMTETMRTSPGEFERLKSTIKYLLENMVPGTLRIPHAAVIDLVRSDTTDLFPLLVRHGVVLDYRIFERAIRDGFRAKELRALIRHGVFPNDTNSPPGTADRLLAYAKTKYGRRRGDDTIIALLEAARRAADPGRR
ncbi:MAG: hypothetical protein ACTSX8_02795 [Alphaproteobacteria bacterium]